MIQLQRPLILLACILFFSMVSCVSAKKKLQNENYKGAFKKALSKLEKDSDDRLHRRILTRSLDKLLRENEQEVQDINLSGVKGLKKAIKLTDNVSTYVDQAIPYADSQLVAKKEFLTDRILNYEHNIADIYAQEAWVFYESAKRDESKLDYKQAFLNFEEALEYNPSLENIKPYLDTCLSLAVRIIHVEANPVFEIMESWRIDHQFDDLTRYSDRFTKIYYENASMKSQADCLVEIEFSDLDFDISRNSDRETFTEQVITGYNTVTDTSGNKSEVPIYQEVSGQVESITETKEGEWRVQVRVSGSSANCSWSGNNYSNSVESKIEKYEISGDERAIPSSYKDQTEDEHKSEEDMSEDMIEHIFEEFVADYF